MQCSLFCNVIYKILICLLQTIHNGNRIVCNPSCIMLIVQGKHQHLRREWLMTSFIMCVKPVRALNTSIITGIFECQHIMHYNQITIFINIKSVFFSWYFYTNVYNPIKCTSVMCTLLCTLDWFKFKCRRPLHEQQNLCQPR